MDAHFNKVGAKVIDLVADDVAHPLELPERDQSPVRGIPALLANPNRRSERLAEKVRKAEAVHQAKWKEAWEADDAARQLRRKVQFKDTKTIIRLPFGTDLSEVILNESDPDLVEIDFY